MVRFRFCVGYGSVSQDLSLLTFPDKAVELDYLLISQQILARKPVPLNLLQRSVKVVLLWPIAGNTLDERRRLAS